MHKWGKQAEVPNSFELILLRSTFSLFSGRIKFDTWHSCRLLFKRVQFLFFIGLVMAKRATYFQRSWRNQNLPLFISSFAPRFWQGKSTSTYMRNHICKPGIHPAHKSVTVIAITNPLHFNNEGLWPKLLGHPSPLPFTFDESKQMSLQG